MNTTATILNLGVQQTQAVNQGSQTAAKGRAAEEMTSDQEFSAKLQEATEQTEADNTAPTGAEEEQPGEETVQEQPKGEAQAAIPVIAMVPIRTLADAALVQTDEQTAEQPTGSPVQSVLPQTGTEVPVCSTAFAARGCASCFCPPVSAGFGSCPVRSFSTACAALLRPSNIASGSAAVSPVCCTACLLYTSRCV